MTASARVPELALDAEALTSYVLGRRTPEGGYCYYRTPRWGVEEPNAPDTLAALQCLRTLGVEPPEPQRTGLWLRGLQAPDGRYPTLMIGWATLRALEVLELAPSRSPHSWLKRWAELLLVGEWLGERDWRGGVGDALRLTELLLLTEQDPSSDQRQRLVRMLEAARDERGGWACPGADLETTAQAVRLIGLAGLPREVQRGAAHFLRSCENEAIGVRVSPGAGTTSVGALWGGLELARALEIALRYPDAIAGSLALLQHPDGGLGARHWAIATLYDTWLGLQAACLLAELQEDRS